MPIYAGVAEIDITPPVGHWMCGYAFRPSGCVGIHDPLYARALVLTDGTRKVALLAMDLLGLDFDLVERVRTGIYRETGIDSNAVMLNATHTHGGPNVREFTCMGFRDPNYADRLVSDLIQVTTLAAEHLSVVEISYGRAPVQIGINRREVVEGKCILGENPAGPVAPYVHVVTVRKIGDEPIAILFSHACHPTTLGGDNLLITAEYCGYACERVRDELGNTVIPFFLQGCTGNINPTPRRTYEDVARHGDTLGSAVAVSVRQEKRLSSDVIGYDSVAVELPLLPPPFKADCEAEIDFWTSALEKERTDGDQGRILHAEGLLGFARLQLNERIAERPRYRKRFEIQMFQISDLKLIGFPAEMFVQYGLDLEQLANGHVIALGYTNGVHGYVPTAADYPLGGYEVNLAYKYYGSLMFSPECESIIRSTAYQLVGAARPDHAPYQV